MSGLAWRADSRKALRLAHGRGPKAKIARRIIAKKLRASPRAEAEYARALVRIFRGIHRVVLARVEGRLESPERRQDDDDELDEGFLDQLIAWALRHLASAFAAMVAAVSRRNGTALRSIGITPESANIVAIVAAAREPSIRLVERAARAYAADVREVFSDPATLGLRVEAIRDLLYARGNVSLSRAKLIAVDQTLRTHALISRARMLAAGVTTGRWLTSHDERVRTSHRELDGETYSIEDGISDEQAAESGEEAGAAPGTPVRCRCVAIPIIAELELEAPAAVDVAAE